MTAEQLAQAFGYAIAVLVLMAGAFWWGWEVRERLALKIERFRVTNRSWVEYDEELKAATTKVLPMKASLHDIRERQSEK